MVVAAASNAEVYIFSVHYLLFSAAARRFSKVSSACFSFFFSFFVRVRVRERLCLCVC